MTEKLGKYLLEHKIGVGGMAEVFLAASHGPEGFRKYVAVKRLLPHLSENADFVAMFLDEARLAARLNHPSIAQIIELGQEQQEYFLAMEYVHGKSMVMVLKACDREEIPIPVTHAAKIVSLACGALEYAHSFTDDEGKPLRLIHRDISPQNIMLSYDGVVKILDFGIAKAAGNLHETSHSSMKGKAPYMSPEQITRKNGLDHRSDIFSLGIVLFELVTRERAFVGETDYDMMTSIVHSAPRDPRDLNPDVDDDLAGIISRALAKDRADRYQSAREMQADLDLFLHDRKAAVDSYALGTFLKEILPEEESPAGRSVPAPLRPVQQTAVLGREDLHTPLPASPRTTPPPLPPRDHPGTVPDNTERDTVTDVPRPLQNTDTQVALERPSEPRRGMRRTGVAAAGAIFAVLIGWLLLTLVSPGDDERVDEKPKADAGVVAVAAGDGGGNPADTGPSAEEKPRAEKKPRLKRKRPRRRRRAARTPATPSPGPDAVKTSEDVGHRPRIESRPGGKPETRTRLRKGHLKVFVKPFGHVYINGAYKGITPLEKIELDEGTYTLRVTCNRSGREETRTIRIDPGTTRKIEMDLRR